MSYAPANLKLPRPMVLKKMRCQENTLFDLLPWPHEMLPSIIYTAATVEVATANGSGGNTFTQKILYLTFVHDHEVLPSILNII